MAGLLNWAEEQERLYNEGFRGGQEVDHSGRMLEVTDVNKQVPEGLGRLLYVLQVADTLAEQSGLNLSALTMFRVSAEQVQMTIGEQQSNREAYLRALEVSARKLVPPMEKTNGQE